MLNSNNIYQSYLEIFKQNDILQRTFEYIILKRNEISDFFENKFYDEIVFIACGSSYWLSLSAVESFSEMIGIPCSVASSGDIIMNPTIYKKKYSIPLFIVPSRSGDTSETFAAVAFLKKEYKSKVLCISENEQAAIGKLSDFSLYTPWAFETSICQTRSFCNLYMICILIISIASKNEILISEIKQYISDFKNLSKEVETIIKSFSLSYPIVERLITLGNGKLFGIACEGAYINMEMAQIPANYFYSLEFRHGPIVLLDETYLVVIFSGGNQIDIEKKLMEDIKSKKAKVLVISANSEFEHADFNFTLGHDYHSEIAGLYGSFIMQAIAYYNAIAKNVNPDCPIELPQWIKLELSEVQ